MSARSIAQTLRARWVSVLTVLVMIAMWEVASRLAPTSLLRNAPIVPSWSFVFGESLLGLSDYWRFRFWAPVPQLGGEQTYLGAALAIGYNSIQTLYRITAGLALGASAGILTGFLLSWSPLVARMIALPVHLMRMCPLLALVPLFQFWFGASNTGSIIYVGYGVGVIFLVSTLNAIAAVPPRFVESAKTFGAGRLRIYRSVIWPAIRPELFSALFLCLGVAWGAVIGAEYIGVESGLGRMIIWAEHFSMTGRMLVMTLFVLLYANIGFWLCKKARKHALRWHTSD